MVVHWWSFGEVHLSSSDLHTSYQPFASEDFDLVIVVGVGQSDDEAPGGLEFLDQSEVLHLRFFFPFFPEEAAGHVEDDEKRHEEDAGSHANSEENPKEKVHSKLLLSRVPTTLAKKLVCVNRGGAGWA